LRSKTAIWSVQPELSGLNPTFCWSIGQLQPFFVGEQFLINSSVLKSPAAAPTVLGLAAYEWRWQGRWPQLSAGKLDIMGIIFPHIPRKIPVG